MKKSTLNPIKSSKKIILASVIFFTSASFAGYDSWNCRERDMLKGLGLQCISCGVQKYYSSKDENKEVVPSEKWIALLAVNARAFRALKSDAISKSSHGYSTTELDSMRRAVIAQIQAYGFCTHYMSKEAFDTITKGSVKPKPFQDLTGVEWDYFKNFVTKDLSKSEINAAAKKFGFKQSTVLGIETGGDVAMENMQSLFDDHEFDNGTITAKRNEFKRKLKNALSTGYDVSGEKVEKKEIFGFNEEDQGLKQCMEEVQRRMSEPQFAGENAEMCKSMVKACDLNTSFCDPIVTYIKTPPTGPLPSLPPMSNPDLNSKSSGGVR